MPSKVKAAMERLTRLSNGESEDDVYRLVEPFYFANVDKRNIDRAILADAYLAAEPVMRQMADSLQYGLLALTEASEIESDRRGAVAEITAALAAYDALSNEQQSA